MQDYFNEQHCPICGKEFYPTSEWVYKEGETIYCSWHCYRQGTAVKKRKNYKYKPVEMLDLNGNVVKTFDCVDDASYYIKSSYGWMATVCQQQRKFRGYMWRYKKNGVS